MPIENAKLFENFEKHIKLFYESPLNETWEGKEYNLISLIHNVEFHSTNKIIHSTDEKQTLFSLIDLYNSVSEKIFDSLIYYLKSRGKEYQFLATGGLLEVSNISAAEIKEIASNFDVIKAVTSSRAERISPNDYGLAIRDYGFITYGDPKNIKVGVIDTGVSRIDVLVPTLSGDSIDITNTGVSWDDCGHGTLVAGIVALGSDFYLELKGNYQSHAEIVPIKVLESGRGTLSIVGIINAIQDAYDKFGVRLFNLSLNDPSFKKYNSTFSEFAYLLDKVAYENDLLVFISAGNIDSKHLKGLEDETNPSHVYPFHFYSPDSTSEIHSCETTNIFSPADSLNNITVGALAGNFENRVEYGVTPAKEYPAIYTRKFHYDYTREINGVSFMGSQKNKFLNKPDLVFYGGDLFDFEAGLEILRSPMQPTEKYFSRSCGTSLATPLVTSMAAKILKQYPKLKTQSVKALLLNSTTTPWGTSPLHFRNNALKGVLKKLVGFGMPNEESSVFSNDNKITFIVEDEIVLEQFKAISIALPESITESGNKLNITATLCYSFLPVKNNHLSYCPLQISFGFFKDGTAKDLANQNVSENKLKSSVSWSDDFFGVENRLFSNSQKISFSLTADQIEEAGYQLALAIKCTNKEEIEGTNLKNLQSTPHKFSLAISVTELPLNKATGSLYNEMAAINQIENIVDLDLDAEMDAEAGS